jgi:tetratricopeptide (TPR) repeat protein
VLALAELAGPGGLIEMAAGEPAAAERVIRQGCERLDAMGERSYLSTKACELAQALYATGRYEEAGAWARRGRHLGASDDLITEALAAQVEAKLLARAGDHEAACRLADRAVELTARMQAPVAHGEALMDRAEVLRLGGDEAGARGCAERAIEQFTRKGATALVAQASRWLPDAGRPAQGGGRRHG